MVTILPDQRVSVAEKQKEEWYVNNLHYWVDLAMYFNDKKQTADFIDAANGVINRDMYEYALNPLSAEGDKIKNLPGVIRDIDFITPIREKNLGEYIELPHYPLVKVDDPDLSMRRSMAVAQQIKPAIEQHLINLINQQQDSGVPSKETPDIEKEVEKLTQKWVDDRATTAQNLIEWMNDNNSYDNQRISAFNDWWSTEEVYFHSWIQGNDVHYEVVEPLNGFPIDNGMEFVCDNDAFVIRRKISINRITEYHGDRLTEKDYKFLQELLRTNKGTGYYIDTQIVEDLYGRKVFDDRGNRKQRGDRLTFSDNNEIWEQKVFWKTQVKIKILHRINEMGEVVTQVVDNGYKLNPDAGDFNIETKWIDEVWTQVLLGEFYSGIYLKPEPVPVQVYDNKGHVKLPITGKKGILNGVYLNPIPGRIAPNQALFRVITLQIERQMAKYKGAVEIIPESMLSGGENADPEAAYFYRLADNTIVYDDTEVDFNTVTQGYRIVGNDSVSNYLKTLIDIRQSVKEEAWEMANMNDSRFGQAAPSSTVTNNQQNIFRAKLGSILMVTMFNQVLLQLHETNLELAKVAYEEGKGGSFFATDGTPHHFNINSGELSNNQYGIFLTNSVIEKEKLDEYRRFAFSAAQNGDFALASKALESDSVSEIRQYVNEFIEARDQFEKDMKMREQAMAEQEIQAAQEKDAADKEHELALVDAEQEHITARELKKVSMQENNSNK